MENVSGDFTADYEHIGGTFHLFDLLDNADGDLRGLTYEARYIKLVEFFRAIPTGSPVRLVPSARTTEEKRALWDEIRARDGEGVIFKRKDALFSPGKGSDDAIFKHKFYATLSAVVDGLTEGKRSVSVVLFDDAGGRVKVGRCTIPPNQDIPAVGEVVEIRYLYAYRGGSLSQPSYLGPRDDVDQEECLTSQLKFKPEGGADGEDD